MQTSNFWKYPEGNNRIAISRAVPTTINAGYKRYRKLAPGPWFKNPEYRNNEPAFRKIYLEDILATLNPLEEWENLHKLAGGSEPILLCWEPLKKPGEYCHRRMLAKWFEDALGVVVPEYVVVTKKNDSQFTLL